MRLFLDDVRSPDNCLAYMQPRIGAEVAIYKESWFVVRNYHKFVEFIKTHAPNITHISYDHDLAEAHYHESMYEGGRVYMKYLETVSEKTGLDCAKFMKEYYEAKKYDFPKMYVHSMNPVGTENIINLFKK